MGIIRHEFGNKRQKAARRFTRLLNLDAVHEANVQANPLPYLERASERIYQLERAILEAVAAGRSQAGVTTSATITIAATEYAALLRSRAIIENACAEIDAHADPART